MSASSQETALNDSAGTEEGREFGLYVHWPFCRSKCPYCDFNSHVRDRIDHESWRTALIAELTHAAVEEAPGMGPLTSIFFGGGTPSLMQPATVAAVLDCASRHWGLAGGIEITLEANPTSVEAGRLADFRAAGINRVSLGIQALDDRALRALGREHSAAEAIAALRIAARLFERFSFDLIYARPGQSPAAWAAELRRALELARDHVSLYQLTIEPGTAFHTRQSRGELAIPNEETAARLYESTQKILETHGMPAYEISNHARRGAECRHNLTYWRYGDYLGIGPGAHGRVTIAGSTTAYRRHRAPEVWLERVWADGHDSAGSSAIGEDERIAEILMMGLRLRDGVDRSRFERLTGRSVEAALDPARLAPLIDAGLLVLDGEGMRASDAGRQRLNAVLGHLLA